MIMLFQEYNASQHRAPPPDMNQHGSFAFTLQEYYEVLEAAVECQDITNVNGTAPTVAATLPMEAAVECQDITNVNGTAPTVTAALPLVTMSANNVIEIPVAGFGVMLTIIILLAIACISLIIVVIVLCVKIKFRRDESDLRKESTPKGEIPLSTTTTAT